MLARRASITAVSGKRFDERLEYAGKRFGGKKTPEKYRTSAA